MFRNFDDSGRTPFEDNYAHIRNDMKNFNRDVQLPTYPNGVMLVSRSEDDHCKGYDDCGAILIRYVLDVHGKICSSLEGFYRSDHRTAYLPDNGEGGKVLDLLKQAWRRKLTFRFAPSSSKRDHFEMAWNISHKTSLDEGGPDGYPDPGYLRKVTGDLRKSDVTSDEGQNSARRKLRSWTGGL